MEALLGCSWEEGNERAEGRHRVELDTAFLTRARKAFSSSRFSSWRTASMYVACGEKREKGWAKVKRGLGGL